MTSMFARFFMPAVLAVSVTALAQNAALPAAPSAAANNAAAPVATNATGTRMGTINVEQAIFATNEGQRDFEALSKKLEPKQTELKGMNDEVESLKKQLNTQGEKLNDDSRGTLVKQIEQKQKSLERQVQDARDDAQNQQNEIAQRILQKMGPMLVKYAADNGYGVIIDTSNPWPNGPVHVGRTCGRYYQVSGGSLQRAVWRRSSGQAGRSRPATPSATSRQRQSASHKVRPK